MSWCGDLVAISGLIVMKSDHNIKLRYDDSIEWMPAFVEQRLCEIESLEDGIVKTAEWNVLLSFIDYRLKWIHTHNISEYQKIADEVIGVCHKHGFTPLFQITGSEDIYPNRINYAGGDGKLFFGRNDSDKERHLYLFSTGQMRCFATFFIKDYEIKEFRLSENSEWLVTLFSGSKQEIATLWDMKRLKVKKYLINERFASVCVFDNGTMACSNGNLVHFSNGDIIQTSFNQDIETVISIGQNRILMLGAHSTIMDLDASTEVRCDVSFSLDSQAYLSREGNIIVFSGCDLYQVDDEGKTTHVEKVTKNMSVPPNALISLRTRTEHHRPELSYDGNLLYLGISETPYAMCKKHHKTNLRFDVRNGLKFDGYDIIPDYPSFITEKNDDIIRDYQKVRPVMSEVGINTILNTGGWIHSLLDNGECFVLKVEKGCIYHLKLVSSLRRNIKAIYRKISLNLITPYPFGEYEVGEEFVRSIAGSVEPLTDEGAWSDIIPVNKIDAEGTDFTIYCKKGGDEIRTGKSLSFVDDYHLSEISWIRLDDGNDSCMYADIDNTLYVVGKNGCTTVEDYRFKDRIDNTALISRNGGVYRIDADGRLTKTPLSANSHVIAVREDSMLFRLDKDYKMLSGTTVFDLDPSLFRGSETCILDSGRLASYSDFKVSVVEASTGNTESFDISNDGKWVSAGIYKNLRFDFVSFKRNGNRTFARFAELKTNGGFRPKEGIDIPVSSYSRYGTDGQTTPDQFIATYGTDVIRLDRDRDEVRLDRLIIGKNGITDTGNAIVSIVSGFGEKTIIQMTNPDKIMVHGMGKSEDKSDTKYKGRNTTELRIVDLKTGLRERTLLRGIQGFNIKQESQVVLFSNDRYVAAESFSEGSVYVNLWECKTGKRYPYDESYVHGRIAYTDDRYIAVYDYKEYDDEYEPSFVLYDFEMREISRKKMDAIPLFDPKDSFRYDGPLKKQNQIRSLSKNDVLWKLTSMKESSATNYAIPINPSHAEVKPFDVEIELYHINYGMLSDPTIFKTTIGSYYDAEDRDSFAGEIVGDSLGITSWNGSYMVQSLMEQSDDSIFPEMKYQITHIHKEKEKTFSNVHNPFDRPGDAEGRNIAYIGEAGITFVEESEDGLILRLIGDDKEKKLELPDYCNGCSVEYADESRVELFHEYDGRLISDWESVSHPENSKDNLEHQHTNQRKASGPQSGAEETVSKPIQRINLGVYIHNRK